MLLSRAGSIEEGELAPGLSPPPLPPPQAFPDAAAAAAAAKQAEVARLQALQRSARDQKRAEQRERLDRALGAGRAGAGPRPPAMTSLPMPNSAPTIEPILARVVASASKATAAPLLGMKAAKPVSVPAAEQQADAGNAAEDSATQRVAGR